MDYLEDLEALGPQVQQDLLGQLENLVRQEKEDHLEVQDDLVLGDLLAQEDLQVNLADLGKPDFLDLQDLLDQEDHLDQMELMDLVDHLDLLGRLVPLDQLDQSLDPLENVDLLDHLVLVDHLGLVDL